MEAIKIEDFNGGEVVERHIVEDTPSEAELMKWISLSGLELKKFFNTSGLVYKEMGLKDKVKTMTQEEAVKLLASNGMLIKRPILVMNDKVYVGFKEESYNELIKG